MKYIYYHKFETKLLLVTNTTYRKLGKVNGSFTWRSMELEMDCNVDALFAVNV